ncbi:uncharacterized protein K460DRAFT_410347 [Cucurbitaria berberidis CBS 394.84]|uniref:Uncharacterized protein n=1 Tax=Cucurbitaria berberidis CBS 394.84 TaxID=1168544 RepID=A0A9P4G939_9PLEO|nr:uncharacterized protein K460DRAFT_410347 [Cucurbitaria berberidis CBS 394.84]KAF1840955.1 hypothetical protein K460DRAFT_410347 [Cucurbitaria berberidis CBS 394.84]
MVHEKRMQGRDSPIVEVSREANPRPLTTDNQDPKRAEATSPTTTSKPPSPTSPTGSRIPQITSLIRHSMESKDLGDLPTPTPKDEWAGFEMQRIQGRSGSRFSSSSKKRQSVSNPEEQVHMAGCSHHSPSLSSDFRNDTLADGTRVSGSSDPAPQTAGQGQSGFVDTLHQFSYNSKDSPGSTSTRETSEHELRAAGDSHVSDTGRGTIQYQNDNTRLSTNEHWGKEYAAPTPTVPWERGAREEMKYFSLVKNMVKEKNAELQHEMKLGLARRVPPRAHTSSFAAHTKASMAKQNEKIEHTLRKQDSPTRETAILESENLRAAITDLETNIAVMRQELDMKSAELISANLRADQAEAERETSSATLGTIRMNIEHVCSIMDQGVQTLSGSTTVDWNAFEGLVQSLVNSGHTPNALHSNIVQLVQRFHSTIQSLQTENLELQSLLSSRESDLAVAKPTAQRERKDTLVDMAEENPAWQTDRDTFKKLFEDERARRKAVEARFQKFKETAEKYYQPDLERKNRELWIDLTRARDENAVLREHVKKHQARAQQWQNEYDLVKYERDIRAAGFEEHIQNQQNEISFYIKEYHDKTHDPDHWQIEGLQRKVHTLERELQTTNDMFGQAKRAKARLEDEVGRLMDANKRREKNIARLGKAWITGSSAPTLVDTASSDAGSPASLTDSASSSSLLWLTSPRKVDEGPRIPRCHLPLGIEKREGIMMQFRKDQQKRREEDEARYQESVKKDGWERFEE